MSHPARVLVLDVGGTHIKMLGSGAGESGEFESGPKMTPRAMVSNVKSLARDWAYDVVSIGYPGVVVHGRIACDPQNLGEGWAGFDFERAFGRPVKIINDAAMQAIGSYEGGRMLFMGFGTGLGTAMIVDGRLEPMELAHLPYRKGRTYEDYVGHCGLERMGAKKWRRHALRIMRMLYAALEPDYVVVGGGNVKLFPRLPRWARRGGNDRAFVGGFRMWEHEHAPKRATLPRGRRPAAHAVRSRRGARVSSSR
jgi:polyphosphate glucokinase